MRRTTRTVAVLLLLGYGALSWGYPWDQDMVDQPSPKPQKSPAPAGPGPGSVPIEGGETLPAPTTDAGMDQAKKTAAALINPIPASAESLARGASLFETNCRVCHGSQGRGDGPVGRKFVTKSPVDLHEDYTQQQADGELFFTLTRGRALMPFYRDALSATERWDVINYVKHEFGNP